MSGSASEFKRQHGDALLRDRGSNRSGQSDMRRDACLLRHTMIKKENASHNHAAGPPRVRFPPRLKLLVPRKLMRDQPAKKKRGVSRKEAARRAWATVNKESRGGRNVAAAAAGEKEDVRKRADRLSPCNKLKQEADLFGCRSVIFVE